jgi:hypothetical protein
MSTLVPHWGSAPEALRPAAVESVIAESLSRQHQGPLTTTCEVRSTVPDAGSQENDTRRRSLKEIVRQNNRHFSSAKNITEEVRGGGVETEFPADVLIEFAWVLPISVLRLGEWIWQRGNTPLQRIHSLPHACRCDDDPDHAI